MVYQHSYQYMRSTTPVSLCKSLPRKFKKIIANKLQTRLSTMHTWLPTVLVLTSQLLLLMVLVVVRSLRRLSKMLLVVALSLAPLTLDLSQFLRLDLCFHLEMRSKVVISSLRSVLECGTSKLLRGTSCLHLLLLDTSFDSCLMLLHHFLIFDPGWFALFLSLPTQENRFLH